MTAAVAGTVGRGKMNPLNSSREEPMSRPALRVTTVAAALVAATALSGCGDTSGGTAASYKGEKISTEQVQDAVRDITTEQPTSQFDPTSAAIFMVLGNDLESLAKKHRVYTSADVARQAFKKVTNPTDAAVRSVQGSFNFTSLRDSAAGNPDLQKLFKDADVKLNPRYGTWEKGKGPVDNASNWIKGSAQPALN